MKNQVLKYEYQPKYCADLADIKAGLEQLCRNCEILNYDRKSRLISRRLYMYEKLARKFNLDFNCREYFRIQFIDERI